MITYNKELFIETASGNKVSRQSVLCGSQNIVLNGKAIVEKDVSKFYFNLIKGTRLTEQMETILDLTGSPPVRMEAILM